VLRPVERKGVDVGEVCGLPARLRTRCADFVRTWSKTVERVVDCKDYLHRHRRPIRTRSAHLRPILIS